MCQCVPCTVISLVFVSFLIGVCILAYHHADPQKKPYKFKCEKKREDFKRWHDHQIDQLGAASNTLFTLTSAALAYSLALLNDSHRALVDKHLTLFCIFTFLFAVCFILGLISTFIRIADFRLTKRRHKLRDLRDREETSAAEKREYSQEANALFYKTRNIGICTWILFYLQGFFFAFGSATIFLFWIVNYRDRI